MGYNENELPPLLANDLDRYYVDLVQCYHSISRRMVRRLPSRTVRMSALKHCLNNWNVNKNSLRELTAGSGPTSAMTVPPADLSPLAPNVTAHVLPAVALSRGVSPVRV